MTRARVLAVPLIVAGGCIEPAPAPVCGAPASYRIDRVDLPDGPGERSRLGLDLDGDGEVDDALGDVMAVLISANPELGGFDAKASARLRADATWTIAVRDCDDGTRTIELGPSGATDSVPITVLVDQLGTYTPVTWGPVSLVTAKLTVQGDQLDGILGFALPMPASARAMASPLAAYLTQELAAGTSPTAATLDADHDGVVTADEVIASEYGRIILQPDLGPSGGPASSLTTGLFSAGMSIHATRMTP